MSEPAFSFGVCGLNFPQMQVGEQPDRGADCQTQGKLSDLLRITELGKNHDHGPLTSPVNDISYKCPGKIDLQRRPLRLQKRPSLPHINPAILRGVQSHRPSKEMLAHEWLDSETRQRMRRTKQKGRVEFSRALEFPGFLIYM